MSRLEIPGECDQRLEVPLHVDKEEEKLLIFESILAISGSKAEVKKPLMEDYLDELENLEALEDLGTTCCLEEAALFLKF
jgi:hypothetical protein